MKNKLLYILSLYILSQLGFSLNKQNRINPSSELNVNAIYTLGIHIGSLEYAAFHDMKTSFTNTIVDYAIEAASASRCLSSQRLKDLKLSMSGATYSKAFTGQIRNVRELYGSEIINYCNCGNIIPVEDEELLWYWEVESNHPWLGLNIYEIQELGYNIETYQGSMTSGWTYYLKDQNSKWVRLSAGKLYYVNWDNFKSLYTFKNTEEFPTDTKTSHVDHWTFNKDGRPFKLTYPRVNVEWTRDVEPNHPWSKSNIHLLRSKGYTEILYHGSMVWGWHYYLKDPQNNWVRLSSGKTQYVNWDNFKKVYNYVKTEQINSHKLSHKDIWEHNISKQRLELIYLQ